MSFYILADNCSDLPASRNTTCKDFQILNLSFFLDNAPGDPTIRSTDFYNKLRAGSMSRTSQINLSEFEDVFRRIIAQGYHEILYLAFSSGLSGTYHSSTVAAQNIMKENPNVRILTVDTLAAVLGDINILKSLRKTILPFSIKFATWIRKRIFLLRSA